MENKVSAMLNTELMNKVKSSIEMISVDLPFLIELNPSESKRIRRMEAGRVDFVQRAFVLATNIQTLRPQFFEISDLQLDLDLCRSLDEIIPMVEKVLKQLIDTRDQAGHEAYGAALEIYNTSKRATIKGVPGAQVAYDELSSMFDRQPKVEKTDSTPRE